MTKKDAEWVAERECNRRNAEVSDLLDNGFSRMMRKSEFSLFINSLKAKIKTVDPDVILIANKVIGHGYERDQKSQVLLLKFEQLERLRNIYIPPYSNCPHPGLQFADYHLPAYFDRELDFAVFALGIASYFTAIKIEVNVRGISSDSSCWSSKYNYAFTGSRETFTNLVNFKSWLSEYLGYHTYTWIKSSRNTTVSYPGDEYLIDEGLLYRGSKVFVTANSDDTLIEEIYIERREKIKTPTFDWY